MEGTSGCWICEGRQVEGDKQKGKSGGTSWRRIAGLGTVERDNWIQKDRQDKNGKIYMG